VELCSERNLSVNFFFLYIYYLLSADRSSPVVVAIRLAQLAHQGENNVVLLYSHRTLCGHVLYLYCKLESGFLPPAYRPPPLIMVPPKTSNSISIAFCTTYITVWEIVQIVCKPRGRFSMNMDLYQFILAISACLTYT